MVKPLAKIMQTGDEKYESPNSVLIMNNFMCQFGRGIRTKDE